LKKLKYPSRKEVEYDVDDAGRTMKVHQPGAAAVNCADLTAAALGTGVKAYPTDRPIAEMKLGYAMRVIPVDQQADTPLRVIGNGTHRR